MLPLFEPQQWSATDDRHRRTLRENLRKVEALYLGAGAAGKRPERRASG
ncbi:hypothetical protein [Xanthobacter autotrophicus]